MRYPLEFVAEGLSRIVGVIPRPVLRKTCQALGALGYYSLPNRRRTVRENLRKFFPEADAAFIQGTTRKHFDQLAEYGLLVLLLPRLCRKERDRLCQLDDATREKLFEYDQSGKGLILLIPHFSLNEAISFGPRDLGLNASASTIFRPIDSKGLNRWITRSRAKGGVELIDRRAGVRRAGSLLRKNGAFVGIFFDQHTGMSGQLNLFADCLASSTPLPDILRRQTGAPGVYLTLRRTGFLEGRVELTPLDPDRSYLDQAEARLTAQLQQAAPDTAAWLWSHRRWKIRNPPHRLLGYRNRKIHPRLLTPDGTLRPDLPRTFPLLVRVPNWLGDAILLIPLLRTFRRHRPDAHITLLGPDRFQSLFEALVPEAFDHYRALPARRRGYLRELRPSQDSEYEAALLFTNSWRGDLEARALQIPLRGGIRRPWRPRPFLTHAWRAPGWKLEKQMHQLEFWSRFLARFGWRGSPDRSPIPRPASAPEPKDRQRWVCFPGSANDPEKRWPVESWIQLVTALLRWRDDLSISLAGTEADRTLTGAIVAGVGSPRLHDLAGKTDLGGLINTIRQHHLAIGVDSGGIHLANALGLPVFALFGPTNPTRTAPVFEAPLILLQPPDATALGGGTLSRLEPETVLEKTRAHFQAAG